MLAGNEKLMSTGETLKYRLVFKGEIRPQTELASVKRALTKLYKNNTQATEQLFAAKGPVILKSGLSKAQAELYKTYFDKTGATCCIDGDSTDLKLEESRQSQQKKQHQDFIKRRFPNALLLGTTLVDQYYIETVLGQGGFGITYCARDLRLDIRVAIKEFFFNDISERADTQVVRTKSVAYQDQFDAGLQRFLNEARNLARFRHPNIAQVLNFFESNGSAYMVMTFEEGESLSVVLKRRQRFSQQQILDIVLPLLDGLEVLHNAGFIHRDIKPDNIYIRKDGSPVLIDFGAVRQAIGEHSQSITAMVSPNVIRRFGSKCNYNIL